MTRHETLHAKPTIDTAGTRQLRRHIGRLCALNYEIEGAIASIRSGDDRLLLGFIREAQGGDADAALTAFWALVPRLCAAIIDRLPLPLWKPAIDDYLSLAYLVIVDLNTSQPAVHLADKVISRTRRRHERHLHAHQPVPYVPDVLASLGPANDDVERQAIARIELAEGRPIRAGPSPAPQDLAAGPGPRCSTWAQTPRHTGCGIYIRTPNVT
jgi:hypothetical protein